MSHPGNGVAAPGAAVDWQVVGWFLAVAFGGGWVLFVVPIAFGAPGSTERQVATAVAWSGAMWMPGLGAILATRLVARQPLGSLGLGRLGPRRYYLWAWALPVGVAVAAGVCTVVLGAGRLDLEFTLIRAAMAQAPGGEVVPAPLVVAIQVAFSLTVAPLLITVLALGEELGWRGLLLPRLLPLGQPRAIALSGLIWGVWHAPAILQGHNYPSQPVLGVGLMVVFCLLLGAILSWLYLETGSPWAPALGHGAINATAGLPLLFVSGVDLVLGGTVASLAGWIPLAAVVIWLLVSHHLPTSAPHPTG